MLKNRASPGRLSVQRLQKSETVLLLDGGGYKKQAESWIRKQEDQKLLHVFNMAEFQKWANKGGI